MQARQLSPAAIGAMLGFMSPIWPSYFAALAAMLLFGVVTVLLLVVAPGGAR
jgi:hypothetical protein